MKLLRARAAPSLAPAVAGATRILDLLGASDEALRMSDISRALGISKASVFRIMRALAAAEYVELDDQTATYRLGRKLMLLGSSVLARLDLAEIAMPYLDALMRRHHEEAHLGVFVQGEVVYLSRVVSLEPALLSSAIGLRAPTHCTSVGKALLAFQRQEIVTRTIAAGLRSYTSHTITEAAALRETLEGIRTVGWATSFEEYEIGLNSVGAPIRDHTGAVRAAISVSGPAHRMTRTRTARIGPELVEVAERISADLGHSPAPSPVRVTQHAAPRARRSATKEAS